MCFSAQVEQRLKTLQRHFGASVDVAAFTDLFRQRLESPQIKIPKALEANWAEPADAEGEQICELIGSHREQRIRELEQELFRQKQRLGDAERKLKTRETKTAREHQRIASKKIRWHVRALENLKRTGQEESDSRIFPFWYAPVIVNVDGRNWIRPMRYHCRPAGKPAFYDRKFNGLYNARRDNLTGFWKELFGRSHAAFLITGFYENVALHDFERRELREGEEPQNVVLQFRTKSGLPMKVACLWSEWQNNNGERLESFAAITDEPPPEIAATGHDRCVIALNDSAVEDWLSPAGSNPEHLDQLLDHVPRYIFEHQLAA